MAGRESSRRRINRCKSPGAKRAAGESRKHLPKAKKPRGTPSDLSKSKVRLFRVVAVLLAPLLFVLIEMGLRIAHFGYPAAPMISAKLDGRKVFYNNPFFSWRFFPRRAARHPDPYVFDAEKPANTYRIFILGASAAQGTPDSAYSFGRILKCMLDERFPQTRFEIINTAMVATNSHVTRLIAQECARHDPDLLIVYLGNNEVVGPFGAGSVMTGFSRNYSLIRLRNALSSTRIGQGLRLLRESNDNESKTWGGMEMWLDQQVRRSNKSLETTCNLFGRNLEDIIRSGKRANADVLLATVACNLRGCAPFASLHTAGLPNERTDLWQDTVNAGIMLEENGDFAGAARQYKRAIAIDSGYADVHFRLARCYDSLHNYAMARTSYINAVEEDTLRFRADARINDTIRTVAGKHKDSVHLVDVVEAIEDNSAEGIPGDEFFLEHVHFNFAGNYLLARTFLAEIEQLPTFSAYGTKGRVLTEAQCAERLVYTDWSRASILRTLLADFLKRPPFTNQLYHDSQVQTIQAIVDELDGRLSEDRLSEIAGRYRKALLDSPDDWWLRCKNALLLERNPKTWASAAEQYRRILDRFANDTHANAKLAMLQGRLKHIDEAIRYGTRAVRLSPGHVFAWYNLGLARYLNNEKKEAQECFKQVITLAPDHVDAYKNLTALLTERHDYEGAETICRRALKNVPDNVDLYINLAVVLRKQNRIDEARQVLEQAVKLDPNSKRARQELESIRR